MSRKKIVGDVLDHWRKYSEYQPTLGYCVSVKHSHHMAKWFNDAGYKALAMFGGMPDKDREYGIKALSDGSIHVLFSCDLFSEGLDIPVVNTGIFLRKTKSLGLWMQQAGRILRVHPGKKNAILLDHVGNSLQSEHGHILNYREWSLDGIVKKDKNGIIPKTTNCPKCFGTWPGEPKVCPSCGFQFSYNESVADQQRKPPDVIQGELKQALPDLKENEINDLTKFISNIQVLDGHERNKKLIAKFFELQDQKRMKEISKIVGYKENWSSVIWHKYIKNKVRN
jgi:superfamily II DNA or RNA helicase